MFLIFLGSLILSLCLCSVIPICIKSFIYSISLVIKEGLIFSLPFVIFALVFVSCIKLKHKAIKYIPIIVILICLSNFTNTIISYSLSKQFINYCGHIDVMKNMTNQTLKSIFSFHLPNLISNDAALLAGILSSFMLVFIFRKSTFIISQKLEYFIKIYFKMLIPLMPLFIIGTALKLQTEGTLSQIFEKYTPVLILFIISAYGWVLLQLYMISKLNFSKLTSYIKKITPAATTAFSTASSASALPLSIKAAEQNISQKINASIIIPTTVNIHLVGDCFFIPMIALVIMHSFGLALPEISNYLLFAIHFCLAKFAVAAIPGGGIIVMLPILQEYLGFQTDMQAIITAIYILFDPIITGCNVIGNGAMAIVFDKIVSQKTR